MQVHYSLLDDMERYDKSFNREAHKDREESLVIPEFRAYYAQNLPVDLLSWCRVNEPGEDYLWKEGYWNQIKFVRDNLNYIFYNKYEKIKENPVMVIGTHRSKSVILPVYEITLKNYGVIFTLRNNFYDWKISVNSKIPLEMDFMGLFKEEKDIPDYYCEGFRREQVYGMWKDNKSHFTVEIRGIYEVFTFMFLVNNYLKTLIKRG